MAGSDWETIKNNYPIGCKVDGIVRKVWKFGALVEVDNGVTGILRNREISWDRVVEDATSALQEGDRVRVAVLRLDHRKHELVCSLRQAQHDPWENQEDRYQVGNRMRGQVVFLTKGHAVVEFEDHVRGRLPRGEIVPWPIESIDQILEQGDFIEARVKDRNEAAREIVLSMKDRLEELGAELTGQEGGESIWTSEPVDRGAVTDNGGTAESSSVQHQRINQILIVDDEETLCLQLEAMLNDLGYENVEWETDFAQAVQTAHNGNYSLILLDVKGPKDEWAGIHAAEDIRRLKPEAVIVLTTGGDWAESSRRGQRLELNGMLLKPIKSDELANAIASLERVDHAGWRTQLDEGDQIAVEFVQNISRAAAARRPLPEVLEGILQQMAKQTRSDKAALFSMDPRTSWIEIPASVNISEDSVRDWRHRLPKSPVNDVIYRGEHILEGNVERFEGKYRNLRGMVEFRSCIGVPVEGALGDLGYGLFLFHPEREHFSESDLVRAEAAALIIGRAIREHWVIEQVATDQRLTLLGGTITSVGHELRNRLNGLEVVPALERAWKQIKLDSSVLHTSDFVQKFDRNLEQLAGVRRGSIELIDVLFGAVRQDQEELIDVKTCVQSAINMVAHAASKAGVDLVLQLEWTRPVWGSRLQLEQVFMNILLNAIQQMPLSRRRRGKITVEVGYYPQDERFPVKIRFTDTGPGIHSKRLEKIFEPMYTTKTRGTGMGLYICTELLALMGGRIRVEQTAILVGTTFVVDLTAIHKRRRP